MKTSWLAGCKTEEEKKERRAQIVSADAAFRVLTGMIEAKIRSKDSERIADTNYSLPAWSEYQADSNGYIRALREVISLISTGSTND